MLTVNELNVTVCVSAEIVNGDPAAASVASTVNVTVSYELPVMEGSKRRVRVMVRGNVSEVSVSE